MGFENAELRQEAQQRFQEYKDNPLAYQAAYFDSLVTRKTGLSFLLNGTPVSYIWIDGEPFLLTIPEEAIWRDIERSLNVFNADLFSEPISMCLLREAHPVVAFKKNTDLLEMFLAGDPFARICSIDKNNKYWYPKWIFYKDKKFPLIKERILFRPMLFPLTEDMHWDQTFFENNSNGTIVEGGSFYIGEKAYGRTSLFSNLYVSPKDTVRIGDTNLDVDPLQWVCWNGVLYGTQNLFHITIKNMLERGF